MRLAFKGLTAAAVLATACWAATSTIIQRGQVGPVKSRMTRADLEKITGASDIVDDTMPLAAAPRALGASSEDSRPCTDLWPKQADHHIRVLFDSNHKVETALLIGQESIYHTADGITLGTDLRTLEKLNGKPFKLSGFGWSFGGRITDWNDGRLQAKLRGLSFALGFEPLRWTRLPDRGESISGERTLLSSDPELHRLDPHVERIEVDLVR